MGYFGFMRAGEFTASALTLEDVAVDRHENPAMIRIRLKQIHLDMVWTFFWVELTKTFVAQFQLS